MVVRRTMAYCIIANSAPNVLHFSAFICYAVIYFYVHCTCTSINVCFVCIGTDGSTTATSSKLQRTSTSQERKRAICRDERIHHRSKDATEQELVSTSSDGGDGRQHEASIRSLAVQKEQAQKVDGTSSRVSSQKNLMPRKRLNMRLRLSKSDSPTCSRSNCFDSESLAEKPTDIVPESPKELVSPRQNSYVLPALKIYLKRSKHSGLPYLIRESPSPVEESHEGGDGGSGSSGGLPHFETHLDTYFRKQTSVRKSSLKSQKPKHILPVRQHPDTACCISDTPLIHSEIPESPVLKEIEKVHEVEEKSADISPSDTPLMSPLLEENAPLIMSVLEDIAKTLSTFSSGSESTQSAEEHEASVAKASSTASTAALKQNKCDESADTKSDKFQSSAVCSSVKPSTSNVSSQVASSSERSVPIKKSRPASLALPMKRPRLLPAELDKKDIVTSLSDSGEVSESDGQQGRKRKYHSASPIEKAWSPTVSQKDYTAVATSESGRGNVLDSSNEDDAPRCKKLRLGGSEGSNHVNDKLSPSGVLPRSFSESEVGLTDQVFRTEPAESSVSDQRREPFPRASVGRSRASSVPSSFCAPEIGRKQASIHDSARQRQLLMKHPYSTNCNNNNDNKEAFPTRYRPLPPLPRYSEPDHHCHSSYPTSPPHSFRYNQASLLGEPPSFVLTHSAPNHPLSYERRHRSLLNSTPPYYHSFSIPFSPPPPHVHISSRAVLPYGPPPCYPPPLESAWNDGYYDQRYYGRSVVGHRQLLPAQEWYHQYIRRAS